MTTKYSFDDLNIGITKTGKCLNQRIIKRPSGINNTDWYIFAGKVVKLLNNNKGESPNGS